MPRKPTGRPPGRPRHPGPLTDAEERVLALLREGLTNAEIAIRLDISPDGVKYHVSNMLGKLDLARREDLARWRPAASRERRWLLIPAAFTAGSAVTAAAGVALLAVVAVAATLLLRDDGDDPGLVAIPDDAAFEDGVSCVREEYFCVVEPLDGGPPIALSTLTAHDLFRERGCQVQWRRATDENHLGQFILADDPDVGAFREPCGGATFLRDGTKVFGPAERSLDRHPIVRGDDGDLFVDTSTYSAGPPTPRAVNLCDTGESTFRICSMEW